MLLQEFGMEEQKFGMEIIVQNTQVPFPFQFCIVRGSLPVFPLERLVQVSQTCCVRHDRTTWQCLEGDSCWSAFSPNAVKITWGVAKWPGATLQTGATKPPAWDQTPQATQCDPWFGKGNLIQNIICKHIILHSISGLFLVMSSAPYSAYDLAYHLC